MSPEEASIEVKKRIAPILAEFGLDAWLLMGYATDGNGHRGRAAIGHMPADPVMRDAMRPIVTFAHMWVTPDASEAPHGRDS